MLKCSVEILSSRPPMYLLSMRVSALFHVAERHDSGILCYESWPQIGQQHDSSSEISIPATIFGMRLEGHFIVLTSLRNLKKWAGPTSGERSTGIRNSHGIADCVGVREATASVWIMRLPHQSCCLEFDIASILMRNAIVESQIIQSC